MIATLARQDYEAMVKEGLPVTLDDFDRLNSLALRMERGANASAANFPRVGWAGGIPFHQPTCAAIAWYWSRVDQTSLCTELKNSCWYYALANGRRAGAFDGLDSPDAITRAVETWLASVAATADEIARACSYAVNGYDDAEVEPTAKQKAEDAEKTDAERRDETLRNVSSCVTRVSALTGIAPDALERETPSRLAAMVRAVERLHDREFGGDEKRMRDEYTRTHRAIVMRLRKEKEAVDGAGN